VHVFIFQELPKMSCFLLFHISRGFNVSFIWILIRQLRRKFKFIPPVGARCPYVFRNDSTCLNNLLIRLRLFPQAGLAVSAEDVTRPSITNVQLLIRWKPWSWDKNNPCSCLTFPTYPLNHELIFCFFFLNLLWLLPLSNYDMGWS